MFARGLNFGDIVTAEMQNGSLVYGHVVERSGHKTFWVVEDPAADGLRLERAWQVLESLGCRFEQSATGWVAVDVPPETDFGFVRGFLNDQTKQGIWFVEESYPNTIANSYIH